MLESYISMKRFLFFFILNLVIQQTIAQVKVTGVIVDYSGQALPSVIVKNLNATNKKMIRFCQTDTEGKFSIEVMVGTNIQIAAMGFKKKTFVVKENMGELHIILEDDTKALEEITVEAKPVHLSGDTIKYLLNTYARPDDRTLADVLTRVPGFEVNKENGEIRYEGKTISNFYIEGINMMGGKYGVATKSLPKEDVATVEVMKHHQPIRILEDFTYSEDNAINIHMKKGAKGRWMTTYNGGIGIKSHGGLWSFETFAMRLKTNFQTILTYKTNNTGENIRRETDNLLNFDNIQSPLTTKIAFPSPSSLLLGGRSLFNRSHAVSLNFLQRINEYSQIGIQVTYTNDRSKATSLRRTNYYMNSGVRTIENKKYYLEKSNDLFAKIKYENNANKHYLKNELSSHFFWNKQWLSEQGTNPHKMIGNLPVYTLRDNFSLMQKYGKRLISFESKNIIEVRPQQMYVDSLSQLLHQHYYETNSSINGSIKAGKFVVSGRIGMKAGAYRFSSDLEGVPDSLGMLIGKSSFTFYKLYATPQVEYMMKSFVFTLLTDASYNHYKYSLDNGLSKFLLSPNLHIRWNATTRWTFSTDIAINSIQINAAQFYPTLVLQDYQYINKGLADYRLSKEKSMGLGVIYSNALQGTSVRLHIMRSFGNSPYTSTQDYVGNYIVVSLTPQDTKYNGWNIYLMGSQSIGFLKGKLNMRALYDVKNGYMMQNAIQMPYNTKNLKLICGLDVGLIRNVDLTYKLTYGYNQMKMTVLKRTSNFNSWKHEGSLRIPLCKVLSLITMTEYYHNQIAQKKFKDVFFQNITLKLQARHFDLSLNMNNILNKRNYSYGINNTLSSSFCSQDIRGRELMLSVYYKP